MQLIIKVLLFNKPYTMCYMSQNNFMLPDDEYYKSVGVKIGDCADIGDIELEEKKKGLKIRTSALFLQPFIKECVNSKVYRSNVVKLMNEVRGERNGTVFLKLILEPPDKEILDYAWSDRILRLVWIRLEIENAFSWLSTLGGAYSALGDYFEHCADEAGRISMRQYKLSKLLGDDSLAARSKLYSAISYAQKGNLKIARHIVRNIAAFAHQTHDKRLNRMCQGVWAKLKYLRLVRSNENGVDAK